jgi:hypothetical protein
MKVGAHKMVHPNAYLADPADELSVRSGLLKTLVQRSPRHAWLAHPKLNPNYKPVHDKKFDLGSAMHIQVLGDPHDRIIKIDHKDYRTAASKAARDNAYAKHDVPILAHQMPAIEFAAATAPPQLSALRDLNGDDFTACPFTDGEPEMTIIWRDEKTGVLCRGRLDWWHHDITEHTMFWDYKTTTGSAAPDDLSRRLLNTGSDFQAAFYCRGIRAITGIKNPRFGFIVQETTEPFALCAVTFDRDVMRAADQQIGRALALWKRCVEENRWPGYPQRMSMIYAPAWLIANERERELVEEARDHDLYRTMIDWQAPQPRAANGGRR